MFIRGIHHALFDAAGNEGAAAGGSTGGAPNGDGGAAGSGAAPAASGNPSALAAGATEKHFIPEKYHVKTAEGAIDLEASSRKLGEAYGHLSARMGTGDVRPKTVDEYTIAVPDSLKGKWEPKQDPAMNEFLKEAHAAGYTQKQIDLAMNRYMEIAPQLVEGGRKLSAEDCVTALRSEWKTDEQYKAEVGKAHKAAMAYGGEDAQGLIADYGNDPRVIRMLNRIGGEIREDKPLNPGGGMQGGETIESLVASEAYRNPKHADHASVSNKIRAFFEAKAAADAKANGAMVM